jgi:ADP-heptose:LPS heptosyltransferase
MGDVVLTSPIVRCVKQQVPGAEVHFAVRRGFAPFLRANPYVDRVIEVERDPMERFGQLRAEGYDFVVDLQGSLRTRRLRWRLGIPSATFPKWNLRKWLLVRFHWDLLPRGVHVVDRYFEAVKPLGVQNDGLGLDCFIDPEDEIRPESLSAELRTGAYVAVAVGATYFTKRIPEQKLVELCRSLLPDPVVLLGGPEDAPTGARVAAAVGGPVVNACGRLGWMQSAAVLRGARHVVAPDTGLMHLAAALRRPMTVFWGSTVPAFGMGPYYPRETGSLAEFREVDLPCRPCSKLGKDACPRGHFRCMLGQNIH